MERASEAWLPAELVTNLYDQSREKRRLIEYSDLPKVFIDALTAAEDQHFFTHWGIDPVRLVGAVIHSVRSSDRIGGTSTITQQFARNFFLTTDRKLSRKATEIFITLMLEQRLSKQQILTLYANETYMGQRGSFSINGFGEAADGLFRQGHLKPLPAGSSDTGRHHSSSEWQVFSYQTSRRSEAAAQYSSGVDAFARHNR